MSRGSPKVLRDERPSSLFYFEEEEEQSPVSVEVDVINEAQSTPVDHASYQSSDRTILIYDIGKNELGEMSLEEALDKAGFYPPIKKEPCFACKTRRALIDILMDCCSVAEPSICIELTHTIESLLERIRGCCQ
jgi:hypothetical protein